MESKQRDADVLTIRITEPVEINILLTKNFTLGILKKMIRSSINWIELDQMQLEIVGGASISDQESDHLTLKQLNIQDEAEIKVSRTISQYERDRWEWRRNLPPGMVDIGVFDQNHVQSHGREILQGAQCKASQAEIERILRLVHGNPNAQFTLIPCLLSLNDDKLQKLRIFADETFQNAVKNQSQEIEDLKINLTTFDLVGLIGSEAVIELEETFGQRYDEILIRRCQAHGKFINFHTDVSLRTMQVALNGDEEYQGGNLVFATQGKLHIPKRRAGTVSIHENDIVHGVSMLHSGVRYGLFFLQKRQNQSD